MSWVNVKQAAEILCVSPAELVKMRCELNKDDLWSIEWKPNSTITTVLDARGCGLLLLLADVQRVARIRQRARVSTRQAIRIYDAIARYGEL